MGGFSAQVQQPQTSQPSQSVGKGGPIGMPSTQQPLPKPDQTADAIPDLTVNSGAPNQAASPRPMGKGGNYQTSATSGQPRAGMPNNYSNTVGQWDNTQQQSQQPQGGGKGKGR